MPKLQIIIILVSTLFLCSAINAQETSIITDINGNVYQTVKIGDQWWMAENLRTTQYRNGDEIPNVTGTSEWFWLAKGAWAYYNNDSSNDEKYGKLYNWFAVGDDRGICPDGWHVPTDDEWKQLEMYLGMSQEEADETGSRGTDEGGKMKSTRTEPDPHPRWRSPNEGATNESGFSGFPGGYRNVAGNFSDIGGRTFWWSSTDNAGLVWSRVLMYNNAGIIRGDFYKKMGSYVRCLRGDADDIHPPDKPTLSSPTYNATGVSTNPTLSWNAISGAEGYTVQLSEDSNMTSPIIDESGIIETWYETSSLDNATKYYWRVNAVNVGGTSDWSDTWSFTTIMEKPVIPVLVSPEDGSVNISVDTILVWEASQRAERYTVQVSKNADMSSPVVNHAGITNTSYQLSNLENSTQYYWRVRATNDDGNSEWSEVWSFTTIVAKPAAPVLLSPENQAVNISVDTILVWNESTGAESYNVQVSTVMDFSTLVVDIDDLTETSFEIEGLENLTIYYWRMLAKNIGGKSDWSEVWSFTTKVAIPDIPVLVSPEDGSVNISIDTVLVWDPSERADSYQVQVSTESDFSTLVTDVSDIPDTSFDISGLESLTTYYWRVRAFNEGGESEWSAVWNFSTYDVTSVSLFGNDIPTEFVLHQNYPNPFNPSTAIRYGIPERAHTRLSIFNTMGQEIATLVNEIQEAGHYEAMFDATTLPSGLYIYRLQAGEYVESRKMLLIK